MKAYTLTTPIYYINDHPHLGTAYTTVLSDVLARFHRSRGQEVFFMTGTDENGEKTMRAAVERGQTPREFVDQMSAAFQEAWKKLDISYDRFIRTTDEDHVRAVQQMFVTLQQNGDIYKSVYEGWYCVADETFFMEAPDEKCPECGRALEKVQQEAYYFALSRYTEKLLDWYREHPDFVVPESRWNEVVRFIESGLRDMCITRQIKGWGITVPGDPDHVVYVWCDALVNYIAACGYPDNPERMEHFWPAALHVVGKDILPRFHATLWPAMLMSAGLPLPRQILAHGWLLMDGEKMSKSRMAQQMARWHEDQNMIFRVTSLRPDELVRSLQEVAGIPEERTSIAVDALRYFLVRDLPPALDAEFSLDRLVERYNADLANGIGNLLNRTLTMLQKYRSSVVPPISRGPLSERVIPVLEEVAAAYENVQPAEALAETWKIVRAADQYIAETKPWVLQKEGRDELLDSILYEVGEACRLVAVLTAPAMPSVAREIVRQLGLPAEPAGLEWSQAEWGGWHPGIQALEPEPIFPKIEAKKPQVEEKKAASPAAPKPAAAAAPAPAAAPGEISIEEFGRVRLRIATILSAELVEGAKKLLRLQLDLGDERRQIVSGIAQEYTPESLVGRQIAVIVNLKPATIRGTQSFGMLLAADVEGKAILLQPDRSVPAGSPVK